MQLKYFTNNRYDSKYQKCLAGSLKIIFKNRFISQNNPLLTLMAAVLLIPIASCKKFLSIDPPKNQLVSKTVFIDDASATSSVVGIYSKMMGSFSLELMQGAITIYPGLSADELVYRTTALDEFKNNSITITNAAVRGLWNNAYQYIYDANVIIEGLNASSDVSIDLKNQLIGESKFIRAVCYFYLVNLFGDVPLVTSTNYQINKSLPRSPSPQIYQLIIEDLKSAENLLSSKYTTNEKVRPNKWAAAALLARAYLYHSDWANAEIESSKVINANTYSLSPLDKVFLKNSDEAIWQLIPVAYGLTTEAYYFIPYSGVPNYQLTGSLLNDFEANDLRFNSWIKTEQIQSQPYYYPYKYKSNQFFVSSEYQMVLRLAEQYLIRAEARARQNNVLGSQADINIIRNRAGLLNTAAFDQPSLLQAIEHERRIEFFAEFGHRWFDLKRTNRANSVLSVVKPNVWQATDTLYPIPSVEIQNNPNLVQNVGY